MAAGTSIATGFFTSAAAGVLGALLIAPRAYLGRFFSAFHAGLALVFLMLVLSLRPAGTAEPAGAAQGGAAAGLASLGAMLAAGLAVVFIAMLYRPGGRGGTGVIPGGRSAQHVLLLSCACAMSAAALDGWSMAEGGGLGWAFGANAVAAASVIGSVIVAMLLGHWYLVRLHLPESYLVRFALVLGAAIGGRTVLLVAGLLAYGAASPEGLGAFLRGVAVDRGLFFWQRVLFGIVAPGVLAIMTYQSARIRATMSATGILYIAVIFVLIGEFLARYLVVVGAGPM
ncbi:MAG TPA: hypothetical protein VFG08_00525 [Candidatus Polarisedimenticolia bacterium]|nr:hypothetical protein [Candidatus Polarisedimenticolia bacterium]